MYLESVQLYARENLAVLCTRDDLIDIFREIEERIRRKHGRSIRLLPERIYKGGEDKLEPDETLDDDEEEG